MDEIGPGVWHWTAFRETIGNQVSSYYLAEERVAIDPMLPPDRPEWFAPEHVLLTCRHHDRNAWALGCPVWVHAHGAYELEGRGEVRTYEWGDELPGGVVAHEVGSLSPDETALYSPARRALRVRRRRRPLGEGRAARLRPRPVRWTTRSATKRGCAPAFERLLELDFDLLLLGHGDPAVGDAKEQLGAFVARS